ncbi:hypothetical protein ACFVTC_18455 [Streptomyces sp. NPDC057950]|uniref:hypothetical protein n=1 Tax=Streptomyces sp. NPDC057950 TaxID=3346288 RepID=UPI0036EA69BD
MAADHTHTAFALCTTDEDVMGLMNELVRERELSAQELVERAAAVIGTLRVTMYVAVEPLRRWSNGPYRGNDVSPGLVDQRIIRASVGGGRFRAMLREGSGPGT